MNSDFLKHYGLDGPLPEHGGDLENSQHGSVAGSQAACQALAAAAANAAVSVGRVSAAAANGSNLLPVPPLGPPLASGVSSNTRRKRRNEELKQATIRQHYYPEGGWGYVIVVVSFLVQVNQFPRLINQSHTTRNTSKHLHFSLEQVLTHGLQMSFGVLLLIILRRWDSTNEGFARTAHHPHHPSSFFAQSRQQAEVNGGGDVGADVNGQRLFDSGFTSRFVETGEFRAQKSTILHFPAFSSSLTCEPRTQDARVTT